MKTGQIKQHMRTTKQNNKKANRIRKKEEKKNNKKYSNTWQNIIIVKFSANMIAKWHIHTQILRNEIVFACNLHIVQINILCI